MKKGDSTDPFDSDTPLVNDLTTCKRKNLYNFENEGSSKRQRYSAEYISHKHSMSLFSEKNNVIVKQRSQSEVQNQDSISLFSKKKYSESRKDDMIDIKNIKLEKEDHSHDSSLCFKPGTVNTQDAPHKLISTAFEDISVSEGIDVQKKQKFSENINSDLLHDSTKSDPIRGNVLNLTSFDSKNTIKKDYGTPQNSNNKKHNDLDSDVLGKLWNHFCDKLDIKSPLFFNTTLSKKRDIKLLSNEPIMSEVKERLDQKLCLNKGLEMPCNTAKEIFPLQDNILSISRTDSEDQTFQGKIDEGFDTTHFMAEERKNIEDILISDGDYSHSSSQNDVRSENIKQTHSQGCDFVKEKNKHCGQKHKFLDQSNDEVADSSDRITSNSSLSCSSAANSSGEGSEHIYEYRQRSSSPPKYCKTSKTKYSHKKYKSRKTFEHKKQSSTKYYKLPQSGETESDDTSASSSSHDSEFINKIKTQLLNQDKDTFTFRYKTTDIHVKSATHLKTKDKIIKRKRGEVVRPFGKIDRKKQENYEDVMSSKTEMNFSDSKKSCSSKISDRQKQNKKAKKSDDEKCTFEANYSNLKDHTERLKNVLLTLCEKDQSIHSYTTHKQRLIKNKDVSEKESHSEKDKQTSLGRRGDEVECSSDSKRNCPKDEKCSAAAGDDEKVKKKLATSSASINCRKLSKMSFENDKGLSVTACFNDEKSGRSKQFIDNTDKRKNPQSKTDRKQERPDNCRSIIEKNKCRLVEKNHLNRKNKESYTDETSRRKHSIEVSKMKEHSFKVNKSIRRSTAQRDRPTIHLSKKIDTDLTCNQQSTEENQGLPSKDPRKKNPAEIQSRKKHCDQSREENPHEYQNRYDSMNSKDNSLRRKTLSYKGRNSSENSFSETESDRSTSNKCYSRPSFCQSTFGRSDCKIQESHNSCTAQCRQHIGEGSRHRCDSHTFFEENCRCYLNQKKVEPKTKANINDKSHSRYNNDACHHQEKRNNKWYLLKHEKKCTDEVSTTGLSTNVADDSEYVCNRNENLSMHMNRRSGFRKDISLKRHGSSDSEYSKQDSDSECKKFSYKHDGFHSVSNGDHRKISLSAYFGYEFEENSLADKNDIEDRNIGHSLGRKRGRRVKNMSPDRYVYKEQHCERNKSSVNKTDRHLGDISKDRTREKHSPEKCLGLKLSLNDRKKLPLEKTELSKEKSTICKIDCKEKLKGTETSTDRYSCHQTQLSVVNSLLDHSTTCESSASALPVSNQPRSLLSNIQQSVPSVVQSSSSFDHTSSGGLFQQEQIHRLQQRNYMSSPYSGANTLNQIAPIYDHSLAPDSGMNTLFISSSTPVLQLHSNHCTEENRSNVFENSLSPTTPSGYVDQFCSDTSNISNLDTHNVSNFDTAGVWSRTFIKEPLISESTELSSNIAIESCDQRFELSNRQSSNIVIEPTQETHEPMTISRGLSSNILIDHTEQRSQPNSSCMSSCNITVQISEEKHESPEVSRCPSSNVKYITSKENTESPKKVEKRASPNVVIKSIDEKLTLLANATHMKEQNNIPPITHSCENKTWKLLVVGHDTAYQLKENIMSSTSTLDKTFGVKNIEVKFLCQKDCRRKISSFFSIPFKSQTEIILLMIGENDIDSESYTEENIRSSFRDLVDKLLNTFKIKFIIIIAVMSKNHTLWISSDEYERRKAYVNRMLQNVYQKHKNVLFWPHDPVIPNIKDQSKFFSHIYNSIRTVFHIVVEILSSRFPSSVMQTQSGYRSNDEKIHQISGNITDSVEEPEHKHKLDSTPTEHPSLFPRQIGTLNLDHTHLSEHSKIYDKTINNDFSNENSVKNVLRQFKSFKVMIVGQQLVSQVKHSFLTLNLLSELDTPTVSVDFICDDSAYRTIKYFLSPVIDGFFTSTPNLLILMLGENDIDSLHFSEHSFLSDIQELIQKLQSCHKVPHIILCEILPKKDPSVISCSEFYRRATEINKKLIFNLRGHPTVTFWNHKIPTDGFCQYSSLDKFQIWKSIKMALFSYITCTHPMNVTLHKETETYGQIFGGFEEKDCCTQNLSGQRKVQQASYKTDLKAQLLAPLCTKFSKCSYLKHSNDRKKPLMSEYGIHEKTSMLPQSNAFLPNKIIEVKNNGVNKAVVECPIHSSPPLVKKTFKTNPDIDRINELQLRIVGPELPKFIQDCIKSKQTPLMKDNFGLSEVNVEFLSENCPSTFKALVSSPLINSINSSADIVIFMIGERDLDIKIFSFDNFKLNLIQLLKCVSATPVIVLCEILPAIKLANISFEDFETRRKEANHIMNEVGCDTCKSVVYYKSRRLSNAMAYNKERIQHINHLYRYVRGAIIFARKIYIDNRKLTPLASVNVDNYSSSICTCNLPSQLVSVVDGDMAADMDKVAESSCGQSTVCTSFANKSTEDYQNLLTEQSSQLKPEVSASHRTGGMWGLDKKALTHAEKFRSLTNLKIQPCKQSQLEKIIPKSFKVLLVGPDFAFLKDAIDNVLDNDLRGDFGFSTLRVEIVSQTKCPLSIKDMLSKSMKDIFQEVPDILLLMIGQADLESSYPLENVKRNAWKLIHELQNIYLCPYIIFGQILSPQFLTQSAYEQFQNRRKPFNAFMKEGMDRNNSLLFWEHEQISKKGCYNFAKRDSIIKLYHSVKSVIKNSLCKMF